MGLPANFDLVEEKPDRIILRDVGPWNTHFTITNDAENVIRRVSLRANGRRIMYYDSEGDLTELLVDKETGFFAGFAPVKD